ncbi:hypothetical protein [Streptomyces sp. ODS28]|uniref:hypothetical protein n=1 Tax=Streptomyces sp. ODS28 TaxID=3136688 RepID=UPI0031F127FF
MKYDVLQIIGAAAVVTFGQSLIRILIDHHDGGLLAPLALGFTPTLLLYAALTTLAVLLTGWSHDQAKALGRRK